MIKCKDEGYWIYLRNPDVEEKGVTGKYLFFSQDRELLLRLGITLLETYKLPAAKMPNKENQTGKDCVLCVYDYTPRYKGLFKLYDTPEIKYRYWKSDEQTNKEYSQRLVDRMDECFASIGDLPDVAD